LFIIETKCNYEIRLSGNEITFLTEDEYIDMLHLIKLYEEKFGVKIDLTRLKDY
jgi:hypothetical protein